MANRMILNETSYIGPGAIASIVDEAKGRAFKKALVVTDKDLIKFGVASKVTDLLEKNGLINKFFGLFGLGPFTMINTSGAVVLGMVYNYLPFMILPIYTAMTKIDDSIIEAAQDLGCNVWHILFRVLVPLTGPGIATGITQVFVPAVSTFIISRMLGGGSNLLIGDLIELQFLGNSYNLNLGSAMSLVLMVIVLLCMSFTSSFDESEMEGVM